MSCDNCQKEQQMLQDIILKHKGTPGALIPILHEAQNIYGYLPQEVLHDIAKGLGMPEAEVYGVATFYSQFSLEKKGKYRINVCLGTACYVKGAQDILDKFKLRLMIDVGECTDDGLFSLEACRCIGACGLAPVVTINGEVYGRMTADMVDGILDKYEAMEQAERAEGGELQ